MSGMQDLDRSLERLAAPPADDRLDGFEAQVWRKISAGTPRAGNSTALGFFQPLPWAAATLALAIGIMSSALLMSSADIGSHDDMAAFSFHSPLAPSTLLDRRS